MKFSFPHLVAYLVGGLTTVAALNPGTVTALLGPALGGYAGAGIALAGALLAFAHSVSTSKPSAAAVADTASTVAKVLVMVPLLSLLGACASIESFIGSPTGAAVIDASVTVAVATAEGNGVPAVQINKVAKAALAADTGVSGTLAAVAGLVNVQIANSGLPAADLAAAKILEVALSASITAKVGTNASLSNAQAAVADILNAVIAASGG